MSDQLPTLGCREDLEQIAKYRRWLKRIRQGIAGVITLVLLLVFIYSLTLLVGKVF